MEKWQYEMLQDQLSRKAENNPYGKNGNFKYEEGYKKGILAAHIADGNLAEWCETWRQVATVAAENLKQSE